VGYTESEAAAGQPPARLGLRVSPGAKRSEIVGRHGQVWKVRVAAPAERGRANEAVLELIAETLSLPRSRVRLVAGASSRDKVIEVEGVRTDDLERLLTGRQRKGKT
jgi:uncharacterized protein (TIGR00251 family)